MDNHLFYTPRTDFGLIKSNQLESIFIEMTNFGKSNIIVEWLYEHANVDVSYFNKNYLNTLLDKLFK